MTALLLSCAHEKKIKRVDLTVTWVDETPTFHYDTVYVSK